MGTKGASTRKSLKQERSTCFMGRATLSKVAKEPGLTPTRLKMWRPEREAAGSQEAWRRQEANAADLTRLRTAAPLKWLWLDTALFQTSFYIVTEAANIALRNIAHSYGAWASGSP